ncbi:hypothetical protein AGMMS49949_00540 [Alphaproteobacteria bacterium]|nr:hypothetical protein AGMMS49949_00540 [Alphaproteobacteria bacterium]GHS95588.1 hypothetical protein AGMMS50296_0180 [Alphaproteobacteria bacterium]
MNKLMSGGGFLIFLKKGLKFLGALGAFLFLTNCAQEIDFENDVPQRAKAISQKQAEAARAAMEVPELKKQYRDQMRGKNPTSLEQLQSEKRALEVKIAAIVGTKNPAICPLCRKKYGIRATPAKAVINARKSRRKKGHVPAPHKPADAPAYQAPSPISPALGFQTGQPPAPYAPPSPLYPVPPQPEPAPGGVYGEGMPPYQSYQGQPPIPGTF